MYDYYIRDMRRRAVNIVKRVVQICSNSCTGSVDSALIQFHTAMDCPLLVNYIDCCNTEKSALKFRELSRELSATRRAFSVSGGEAIFAAIKRKRVTELICSMTQFVFYLAI